MQSPNYSKRKRATQACDFCHSRGLKCRMGEYDLASGVSEHAMSAGCLTCVDYGVECTSNREFRKRGRKSAKDRVPGTQTEVENPPTNRRLGNVIAKPLNESKFGTQDIVRRLVQIYHDTMYPNFPFLPEKDLLARWANHIPDRTGGSYMLLMALCAVSSQTASLGAVFDQTLLRGVNIPDSENYFHEAISVIPFRIVECLDLDYLRSFGLLAIYSIQRGNHSDLHRYLALYLALVAQHGFHEESRWPTDLSISDIDDRRRLFWCMYRIEIHSACILGHVVRMPESQVTVYYPRITPSTDPDAQAWISGWDYITDLFRLLEYAMLSMRVSKTRKAVLSSFCERPSSTALLSSLAQLKAGKPSILLGIGQAQNDFQSNRCRYLAVQIICTETLVNIMALLNSHASGGEMMKIVDNFLEEATKVSLILFKVSGSPLVHQLLGVGHMLYNAAQHGNGQHSSEAKRLITSLGELVKSLQNNIPSASEYGDRLFILAGSIS